MLVVRYRETLSASDIDIGISTMRGAASQSIRQFAGCGSVELEQQQETSVCGSARRKYSGDLVCCGVAVSLELRLRLYCHQLLRDE